MSVSALKVKCALNEFLSSHYKLVKCFAEALMALFKVMKVMFALGPFPSFTEGLSEMASSTCNSVQLWKHLLRWTPKICFPWRAVWPAVSLLRLPPALLLPLLRRVCCTNGNAFLSCCHPLTEQESSNAHLRARHAVLLCAMMRLIVNSLDDAEWLFHFFCFVRGADIIENSIIVSTLFMWRFQEKRGRNWHGNLACGAVMGLS